MLETAEDYLPTSGFSGHESETNRLPVHDRRPGDKPRPREDNRVWEQSGKRWIPLFAACPSPQFVPLCIHRLHKVLEMQPELRWKLSRQAEAERW